VRVGSGADCEEDDEEEGLEVEESGLWEGVGVWLAGCLGGGGKGVVDDGVFTDHDCESAQVASGRTVR
jgi:hypothetical protein